MHYFGYNSICYFIFLPAGALLGVSEEILGAALITGTAYRKGSINNSFYPSIIVTSRYMIKYPRVVIPVPCRETANVNLYHVTKFPLYLSFTVHYFYTYISSFAQFFSHKNCFEQYLYAVHFLFWEILNLNLRYGPNINDEAKGLICIGKSICVVKRSYRTRLVHCANHVVKFIIIITDIATHYRYGFKLSYLICFCARLHRISGLAGSNIGVRSMTYDFFFHFCQCLV